MTKKIIFGLLIIYFMVIPALIFLNSEALFRMRATKNTVEIPEHYGMKFARCDE